MIIKNSEDLSSYVREQRKLQGLSQTSIGSVVGLKQSTVSEFETRPQGTKVATLLRILAAVNLELHLKPMEPHNNTNDSAWHEQW